MVSNPKVFISHASEDKERFVLRFAERLRSNRIDAWLDIWEMLPGDKLVDKVFHFGLGPSDVVIVVLSDISITKPWVQKELEIAVVLNVEANIRLIPLRLDKCPIPVCLIDTLYYDVRDLSNYDGDFERIVNAIYGQYEKPPLGERPAYVQPNMMSIGDLTPIDTTIFEHACRIAIEQGHADSIDAERLISELNSKGISELQIMEPQEVLEGRSFIEPQRVIGPPSAYDFAITTYGFEEFAKVGIPNYGTIVMDIARRLAQNVSASQGQYSNALAGETGQSIFLVEHIVRALAANGSIEYDGQHEGDLYVYKVSPELRRRLGGNR